MYANLQPKVGNNYAVQARVRIHKLAGDPTADGKNHNGAPWTPAAGNTPVAGVVFQAWAIGCGPDADHTQLAELWTGEGWSHIQGLTAEIDPATGLLKKNGGDGTVCKVQTYQDPAGTNTNPNKTFAPTSVDGIASKSNVPQYAYLVEELDNPAVKTKVEPFILTVPMAYTPAEGETRPGYTKAGYLYLIDVYPKNTLKEQQPTKEPVIETTRYVLPDGTVAKDAQLVNWTIKLPVNQLEKAGSTYSTLSLVDTLPNTLGLAGDPTISLLPAGRVLEFPYTNSDGETLYKVEACTATAGDDPCATTGDPANYTDEKNPGSSVIRVSLTPEGIAKSLETKNLAGNKTTAKPMKSGDTIIVRIPTIVRAANVKPEEGSVKNTATYTLNNKIYPVSTYKDGGKDVPAELNYGTIDVDKVMGGSEAAKATKLAGAKFDLWMKDDSSKETIPGTSVKGTQLNTLKDGDTSIRYTTVEGGKFAQPIKVYLGQGDDTSATYYLVEAEPPAGYQLGDKTAFEFTFTRREAQIQQVANPRKNIDETAGLPITGAQGLMLLTLGGAAVILVGVGSMMIVKRRQSLD